MSRRAWLWAAAAAVAVVVVGVAAWVVVGGDDEGPGLPNVASDPALGLQRAADACSELRHVEALVRANGAAEDVLSAADRASTAGRLAAAHDVRWISLSSGIDAVRLGLRKDDAAAANVGIRSARAQCDVVDAETARR